MNYTFNLQILENAINLINQNNTTDSSGYSFGSDDLFVINCDIQGVS